MDRTTERKGKGVSKRIKKSKYKDILLSKFKLHGVPQLMMSKILSELSMKVNCQHALELKLASRGRSILLMLKNVATFTK